MLPKKKTPYIVMLVLFVAGAFILYLMPSDNQIEFNQVGGHINLYH